MRLILTFLLLFGLAASARAQQQFAEALPEKPEPIAERPHAVHKFLDLQGKIANSGNVAVATLDAVGTCRTLAAGGHEDWLPAQNCAGTTLLILGGAAADISIAYLFHRTGHHKLERILEVVGTFDSIAGIAHTTTHGGKW